MRVITIVLSGSTVYMGGNFGIGASNRIGGKFRNRIAAMDVTTGSATYWDPDARGNLDQHGR